MAAVLSNYCREIHDAWSSTPRALPAAVRPIRVCFLIDRLRRAGTESQLLALIEHLDRARVQPYLCLLDGEDAESQALEPAGCPVLRLGVRSLHRPRSLVKAWQFFRFLKHEGIDVLQLHFPDSSYFGMAAGKLAGVPRIVRTRFNLGYWVTFTHRWLGRLCTRLADGTVTNCAACKEAVIADEWARPDTVAVLENGVDLKRFARASHAHNGPRRVGMVANLRPVKDPQLFVQAAKLVAGQLPDVEFAIAGDGELREALEKQIAAAGLNERLRLPGKIVDVPAFLAGLDVAVLCSQSEGSSNALLEYMAAGRPLVATAVGGSVQLVEDHVHGLLVPPGDTEALAGAIVRLLQQPHIAGRLGGNARRRVEQHYSLEARARRFENFYGQLLG